MKSVRIVSVLEAVRVVEDGHTLLVGGFGMTGAPVHLLHALATTGVRDLTYVGNNVGEEGLGGGRLLRNGQIRKAIGSYFTSNPEAVAAALDGRLEVELLPQGSLAEALRAGGAGIAAFYTPTAAGTLLAKGVEIRDFGGRPHVLTRALRGDVAFVRAHTADKAGNLIYRRTERNFNQAMATAADVVVAEVERIVDVGEIPPEHVHTPGVYVDLLVQASIGAHELGSSADVSTSRRNHDPVRLIMARRALAELRPGNVVNLGIGIPTLVGELIRPGHAVTLQTENGMLGVGPAPTSGGALDYPVNAGKAPVTALPGASYFDSAESFGMIRGGHVDVAIMGGLQVDPHGNLANWAVPGKPLLGVGGAMDLASGAKRLIVMMSHLDPDGEPKLVNDCSLPLTAAGAVDLVITDLGVFTLSGSKFTLIELMPGVAVNDVVARTAAPVEVALRE